MTHSVDSRLVCPRDAVKCGYSTALHLVLFIYTFKTHIQNEQVEQHQFLETFPPAAPLLLIFWFTSLPEQDKSLQEQQNKL